MAKNITWTKELYNRKDWDYHIDGHLIKGEIIFIIGRSIGGVFMLKDLRKGIEYKRPTHNIISKQDAKDLAKSIIENEPELILFI